VTSQRQPIDRVKRTLTDVALIALAAILGAVGLRVVTLILDAMSALFGTSPTGRILQESLLLVLSAACLLSWAIVALTVLLKRIRETESTIADTIKMVVPLLNALLLLRTIFQPHARHPRRRRRSVRVA
jgi:hypothetical protein